VKKNTKGIKLSLRDYDPEKLKEEVIDNISYFSGDSKKDFEKVLKKAKKFTSEDTEFILYKIMFKKTCGFRRRMN